jgi:hypothetical protein
VTYIQRSRSHAVVIACVAASFILAASAGYSTEAGPGRVGPFSIGFRPGEVTFGKALGYDVVRVEGCDMTGIVGHPMLPAKTVFVSIPKGTRAAEISVSYSNPIELPGSYAICPVQQPVPVSASSIPLDATPPDRAVYSRSSEYPGEIVSLADAASISGHSVAAVIVYPIQYIPAQKRLVLYTDIEFELTLEPNPSYLPVARRSDRAEGLVADSIKDIVVNPEDVEPQIAGEMARFNRLDGGIIECLIITKPEYVPYFEELAVWKTRKGVPTQVVTDEWVYSNYTGPVHDDNQERIRECIKDYYLNKGLIWAVLGGDTNRIPYREAYAMSGSNGENIPCDLYFSDMDGTWNDDGDSRYGEVKQDNIDMYPDVWVSRVPCDTEAEADLVVQKVLQYEGCDSAPPMPTDYQLDVTLIGNYLDENTDCADLMEVCAAYMADRFDPLNKLYTSWGTLSRQSLLDSLELGQNIVNHAGHGSTDVIQAGNDYVSGDDLFSLANAPRYSGVFYSLSCYSGHMPTDECVAEKFVLAPNGGGFYIGNAHYGWYQPGDPKGSLSARLDRYYFMAIGKDSMNYCYQAAYLHAKAKIMAIPNGKSSSIDRYIIYELNLFGDAEMPVWDDAPEEMTVAHPTETPAAPYAFPVRVEVDGVPVEDALVTLWKGDEVYLRAATDAAGRAILWPEPATTGEILVTVTKKDHITYQGSAQVTEPECRETSAPDPEPYCEGALFGEPANGYPGWVWFSVPLIPSVCQSASPPDVLGFDCSGVLWRWDTYAKASLAYNPPYSDFDLAVGQGYLVYLTGAVGNPAYQGLDPWPGYEVPLGRAGWVWLGKPGETVLSGDDFGESVRIRYPSDASGRVRTATEDRSAPDPWLSWAWSFYDTHARCPRAFTPFAPFGSRDCEPWLGYRAYVFSGSATDPSDPDQATLIWPGTGG